VSEGLFIKKMNIIFFSLRRKERKDMGGVLSRGKALIENEHGRVYGNIDDNIKTQMSLTTGNCVRFRNEIFWKENYLQMYVNIDDSVNKLEIVDCSFYDNIDILINLIAEKSISHLKIEDYIGINKYELIDILRWGKKLTNVKIEIYNIYGTDVEVIFGILKESKTIKSITLYLHFAHSYYNFKHYVMEMFEQNKSIETLEIKIIIGVDDINLNRLYLDARNFFVKIIKNLQFNDTIKWM